MMLLIHACRLSWAIKYMLITILRHTTIVMKGTWKLTVNLYRISSFVYLLYIRKNTLFLLVSCDVIRMKYKQSSFAHTLILRWLTLYIGCLAIMIHSPMPKMAKTVALKYLIVSFNTHSMLMHIPNIITTGIKTKLITKALIQLRKWMRSSCLLTECK